MIIQPLFTVAVTPSDEKRRQAAAVQSGFAAKQKWQYLGRAPMRPVYQACLCLAMAGLVFMVALQGLMAGENIQAVVRTAFGEDCETKIIKEVSNARKEVLVAIYSLTRRNINSALVKAVKRGVQVTVKYDNGQAGLESMKDSISYLKKNGVQCQAIKMSDAHGAMHHKFMVIDRKCVITGSYNYTVPATLLNYENLVVLESVETAGAFAEEFEKIKDK